MCVEGKYRLPGTSIEEVDRVACCLHGNAVVFLEQRAHGYKFNFARWHIDDWRKADSLAFVFYENGTGAENWCLSVGRL